MAFMSETLVGTTQTEEFAKRFLITLLPSKHKATIVGLSGDLGSGKTTFVKYLAKEIGITDEVVSPTFILAKYYELAGAKWKRLIHIDAYRFDDPDEIEVLKWEDMIADTSNLILFEWPERIGARFPVDATLLRLTFINEDTRNIALA